LERKNFIEISSILKEKHRKQEKIPRSKEIPTVWECGSNSEWMAESASRAAAAETKWGEVTEDDDETEHGNMIGGADLSVLRQIGTSRK
jgi:hypothetical protein